MIASNTIKKFARHFSTVPALPTVDPIAAPSDDPLAQYVLSYPSSQNAIDIFSADWSSDFPAELGLRTGFASLFDDARVKWFISAVGGIEGKRILELGPLEGAHSFLLEQDGASEIVSIEANSKAYLKCLITKEILGIQKAKFLLGDFVEYLRRSPEEVQFDSCLACGVLYHLRNPAELFSQLAKRCREYVFLWTHYYDEAIINKNESLKKHFTEKRTFTHDGFEYMLHRQEYQDSLGWSGYCGGTKHYSEWMSRKDLLASLDYFGFEVLAINFENTEAPSGPALALIAKNRNST